MAEIGVIHRLQAFSNAIRRTFVQHFTRFQLTECSHGSSGLAELLVFGLLLHLKLGSLCFSQLSKIALIVVLLCATYGCLLDHRVT